MGLFKIKPSKDEKVFFTLEANNGEVLATSETYESKQAAKKGIKAVQIAASDASIIDETI